MQSSWRDLPTGEALQLFQHAAIQARGAEEREAVERAHEAHFVARWQDGSWEEADAARAEMERLLARPNGVEPGLYTTTSETTSETETERMAAE